MGKVNRTLLQTRWTELSWFMVISINLITIPRLSGKRHKSAALPSNLKLHQTFPNIIPAARDDGLDDRDRTIDTTLIRITTKEKYIVNDAGKNVETVRRGYAAFNSGDMKTLTEIFHESASWHTPGRNPIAIHHNTAKRNGKQLDVGCCLVFEFKDGRVIDGREHFFDLYAWDKFWS